MTHFGILARQQFVLNPMCVLGQELQRRGHRYFWNSDIQPKVMRSELNLWILGSKFPVGILDEKYKN